MRDMDEKVKQRLKDFERLRKAKEKQVLSGEITKQDFKAWLEQRAWQDKRFKQMAEVLAHDTLNANKMAASMTNDTIADVFVYNANYATYFVESEIRIDTSFTLYNRESVKNIIENDPSLLPTLNVNASKDLAWNRKRFNNAIVQGILQGESIPKIAKRVQNVTNSNYKAAVRNARTAKTCSQSAGRLIAFSRAEELGIQITKIWIATVDNRTRHSHRYLDGQEVKLNEPFISLYGEINFPGDPDADPADVYNCRCTIIASTPNIDIDVTDLDARAYKLPEGISYEDWENMHPDTI